MIRTTWALGVFVTACTTNYTYRQDPVAMTAHVEVSGPAHEAVSSGGDANNTLPDVPAVAGTRVTAGQVHDVLDTYGAWDDDAEFGQVWYPAEGAVARDFVPYGTDGQWLSTDAGMYWQSTLPFGWLTFHYGRWVHARGRWGWMAGAQFAPAWVDWRTGGGWVGWSPLAPLGSTYDAPWAFCASSGIHGPGLWSRTTYGPATASLYPSTVPVPATTGFGGASYSPGPTGQQVVPSQAPSVSAAWHGEVSARAGMPVSDGARQHSGGGFAQGNPDSPRTYVTPRTVLPPGPPTYDRTGVEPVPRWSPVGNNGSAYGRYRTVVIPADPAASPANYTARVPVAGASNGSVGASAAAIASDHAWAPQRYTPGFTGRRSDQFQFDPVRAPAVTVYRGSDGTPATAPAPAAAAPSPYAARFEPSPTYRAPSSEYRPPVEQRQPTAYQPPPQYRPAPVYQPPSAPVAAYRPAPVYQPQAAPVVQQYRPAFVAPQAGGGAGFGPVYGGFGRRR